MNLKIVFKSGETSRVTRTMKHAWTVAGVMALAALAGCGGRETAPATPSAANAPAPSATGFGVLVMAHGGSPEWNQGVIDSVAPLKDKYPIEIAFGMADAISMQDGVKRLEAKGVKRVGVVRLFVSGESWTERTEQIFGVKPGAPPPGAADPHAGHGADPHAGHGAAASADPHAAHGGHGGHSMAFFKVDSQASYAMTKDGLSDAPSMGDVLADRAAALSKDPSHEDILILAHGPEDDGENQRWLTKLDTLANAVRKRAPFRRVQVETLREDWPDKRVEAEKRIRGYVERAKTESGKAIVIPFRVQGFGPYKDVLKDLDYVADGKGLIPHPEVTKWIEAQIKGLESAEFRPRVP